MTLLFKPMKATTQTPDLTDITYPCLASPKLDGIRCIMADGIAWTRTMKRVPNKFIQKTLGAMDLHGLDGELMVNGDFNNVQSAVMSEAGEPDFFLYVFDDFFCTGGFTTRFASASRTVSRAHSKYVKRVPHSACHNPAELQAYWDLWESQGYEGGIVRAPNGPYKNGRSTLREGYLIKLKKWIDDECIIIDFEEGQTNQNESYIAELGQTKRSSDKSGMVASGTLGSIIAKWNGKDIKIGSGFNDEQRRKIWNNKERFIGDTVSFKYQELTKYGMPRFPIFKGVRHD